MRRRGAAGNEGKKMSYQANLQSQIESTKIIIEKCEQELSLKSLEYHMREAWESVLSEAKENMSRLNGTSAMDCFL